MKKYNLLFFTIFSIFVFNLNLTSDVGSTWVDEVKREGWLAIRTCWGYPIELLLTDFEGRRTGFIKEEKKEVAEIPLSAYSTQVQPNLYDSDSPPWREIEIMYPKTGKYTLDVIGIKEELYYVAIYSSDKNDNSCHIRIDGIISKGDIHRIELYYSSDHSIFKTTAKKVVDLNLLEKELKLVIKHRYIKKKLGKELLKKLKVFKKTYNAKKPDKNILESFIAQLEAEKSKYKEIENPHLNKNAEYIVLRFLIEDAKSFIEELK